MLPAGRVSRRSRLHNRDQIPASRERTPASLNLIRRRRIALCSILLSGSSRCNILLHSNPIHNRQAGLYSSPIRTSHILILFNLIRLNNILYSRPYNRGQTQANLSLMPTRASRDPCRNNRIRCNAP